VVLTLDQGRVFINLRGQGLPGVKALTEFDHPL
jgi:hypothetical protein